MAALKFTTLLLAVLASLTFAKPPPGYVKKPDTDEHPPKYEFGYDVRDGKGSRQGHLEAREGELARGMYYVNLPGGAEQQVQYFADDWGYHPLVSYSSSGPHGSSSSQFALGEKAVAALRGAASKGLLSPIDIVSKSLKSTDASNVLSIFGTKASASASAPQALALVAAEPEAAAQQQASSGGVVYAQTTAGAKDAASTASTASTAGVAFAGQDGYSDATAVTTGGETFLQIKSQQSGYEQSQKNAVADAGAAAGEAAKFQTTVVQPVSNLLVQLPQVTYQTSFDASGSAITYTHGPHEDTSVRPRLHSSQSGHYHFVSSNIGLPPAQQVLVVQEQDLNAGSVNAYANNDVEASTAASAGNPSVRVSYSQSSSSSSSSGAYNEAGGYVSSTPAPIVIHEQGSSRDVPIALNLIAQQQLVASQSNYNDGEKNGVLHLKYSSKNNNAEGSRKENDYSTATTASQTQIGSGVYQVNPTISTPIVNEHLSFVTASGGGSTVYSSGTPSGSGYTVSTKDIGQTSQLQEDHFVQVSGYGGETNAAAEFGAKLKPGFRVKVTSTSAPVVVANTIQKEYVRYNEVHNVEEYQSSVVTQTPLPRSSFKPIVVAELQANEEVSVVTPSPALEPEASNPAVVFSGASYSSETSNAAVSVSNAHVESATEQSYASTASPVVVTPEPAYSTSTVTHNTIENTTPNPAEEKEVLITPRPSSEPLAAASALVSSSETGNKISATLPRVNSPNFRRQFKNKFGLRTNKVAVTPSDHPLPSSTPSTPTGLAVTEETEAERTRTIVEIQKAIPYELPVQNIFPQSPSPTPAQIFVPAQTPSAPTQVAVKSETSDRLAQKPSGTQDANRQVTGSQQSHSQLDGSQLLLATFLEDYRPNGQKVTYVKPELVPFRPQPDTLNAEFLNQIQIANAQSLLQAIQYESLRAHANKSPKEEKSTTVNVQEEIKAPVALPLVSQPTNEQQIFHQDQIFIKQKPSYNTHQVVTTYSPKEQQYYESESAESDDTSTIFDIAKKVKQQEEALSSQSKEVRVEGKKSSKIPTFVQLESDSEFQKKTPQIQIAISDGDKEHYTKEQLEALQKDIQSSYNKYLSDITKQVTQTQQYFGLLAQQPFTFNQQSFAANLQEASFPQEQAQTHTQSQVQVQAQMQSQVQSDPQQQAQRQPQVHHRVPQNFLQQLLEAESQGVSHAAAQQLPAEAAKEEAATVEDSKAAASAFIEQTKVLELEKPTPAEKAKYVALEKPALVAQSAPVERTKFVEVEKPVPYPQPLPVPHPLAVPYAVPHPVEVPVHHVVAVPHFVQVPVKEYHPLFVPSKAAHGGLKLQGHAQPPPPPLPVAYNFPHKDNLHRALLKQHGDSAPYGIGRYAAGSGRRPYPPAHLGPHGHPHAHPHPYRSPVRPRGPPPPPPPPPPRHRGKLRHLCIEYGGFRPPLVPSRQIDEDPAPVSEADAKTD